MKRLLRILCAMALMMPFAACEPQEGGPNGGGNDNDGLTMAQVVGTWQSTRIMVNGEDVQAEMSITMRNDGTGYMDDPNDVFHFTLEGMNVMVTPPHGEGPLPFTVESITDSEMVMSGNTIPNTDQQASFKGWFRKV